MKNIVDMEYQVKKIIFDIFPTCETIEDVSIDSDIVEKVSTILLSMIHLSMSIEWLDSDELLSNYHTLNEYLETYSDQKEKVEKYYV